MSSKKYISCVICINILFLSENFYPFGSGAEIATYAYARLLSQNGFNVTVITNAFGDKPRTIKDANLVVHYLPLFGGGSALKYSILKRVDFLLSSFMSRYLDWADVVYVPRFWFSSIIIAKLHKKPVIMHLHDYIPICPLSTRFCLPKGLLCDCRSSLFCQECIYSFERKQYRSNKGILMSVTLNSTVGCLFPKLSELCDAIICVSKSQRDLIISAKPSISDKLSVIYNPLPELSEDSAIGNDLGYFGGLSYLKGFLTLYEAAKKCRPIRAGAVKIVSTNFNNLEKKFAFGLSQAGFLPFGRLKREDFERLYQQVRVVAVPSIWPEPWPYVVIEALLRGRYVIASKVGGIPEQTYNCRNVSLIEAGNSNELSANISEANCLNQEILADSASHNRRLLLKRFTNEDTLRQFAQVIEKVV